ncbi:MAG: hypothetical protein U0136_17615 [Bdellovibrionota bacterium]
MIFRSAFLTVCCVLLPVVARAEFSATLSDRSTSNVGIILRSPFDMVPQEGVYPLVVSITNDTSAQHTWSLTMSSGGWNGGGETRRTFTVGPHKSERFDVFLDLPSRSTGSYSSLPYVQTTMSGYGVEYPSHSLPTTSSGYNSAFTPYVVMSDSFRGIFDRLHSEWNGNTGAGSGGTKAAKKQIKESYPALASLIEDHMENVLLVGSQVPTVNLPDDWRGLLSVDQLWLRDSDWTGAPPPIKTAVKQWLLQGGQLLLFSSAFSASTIAEWGLVSQDGRLQADYGAGRVYGFELDPNGLSSRAASEIVALGKDGKVPVLSGAAAVQDRHSWTLIPPLGGNAAVGAIVVLTIVAYAFLVGPINVFYYARKNRAFLYVTTPLISIAATLALCVFIIFRDGIGGSGDRYVVVVLSPKDKQQLVVQQHVVRTGLLLHRNFRLPEGTVLRPVSLDDQDDSESAAYRRAYSAHYSNTSLDFSRQDAEYVGDWFRNRSTFAHIIQSVGGTRARIELTSNDAGSPRVFSSIDAELDELFYVDRSGSVWRGENVSAGKNVALSRSTQRELSEFLDKQRKLMGHASDELLSRFSSRSNYYFAVSRHGAPEAFQTLPSIRWSTTTAMFVGEIAEASS